MTKDQKHLNRSADFPASAGRSTLDARPQRRPCLVLLFFAPFLASVFGAWAWFNLDTRSQKSEVSDQVSVPPSDNLLSTLDARLSTADADLRSLPSGEPTSGPQSSTLDWHADYRRADALLPMARTLQSLEDRALLSRQTTARVAP